MGGCLFCLLFSLGLQSFIDPAHLLLIDIGCVVGVSALWGRGPGVLAAILTTVSFDFFFLPPLHSLRVTPQHLISLSLLLGIALAVGQLAARLRHQATSARLRQENAQATAQLARDLTGAVTSNQAIEITKERMREIFGFAPQITMDTVRQEDDTTEWILPLRAPRKVRGFMRMSRSAVAEDDRTLLETFAAVCALSLERIHFVEVAQDALLRMEGEKMRSHVLSCLSHDLRTPLTGIVAHSGRLSVGLSEPESPADPLEMKGLADSLHRESTRMADLVENLLDLARLQSGGVRLRLDWHALDDLCASALRQRQEFLGHREVVVDLPETLPLVWCDGVLVERVIVNFLDNAHRYTPPEGKLRLWANSSKGTFAVGLDDEGPGLQSVVQNSETQAGGIGLSLCRAIAKAHGGELILQDTVTGARVSLRLPQLQAPPEPPLEEEA